MHKKIYIVLIILGVLVATGLGIYALTGDNATDESVSSHVQQNGITEDTEPETGEAVTKVGTFGCLTVKDASGPQTMECAFGLTQDDGTAYALRADDPMLIGTIPTGTRVQVTGTLTKQTTKYETAGTIKVESVQQL